MKKMTLVFLILLSLKLAAGEKMQKGSEEALQQTQGLMQNSKQRNEYIKNNDKAKKADDFLKELVGNDPKLTDEVYGLASEVFAIMTTRAEGDPAKMKEEINQFQKNPEGFAETWTPEQKAKLLELSKKINTNKVDPK